MLGDDIVENKISNLTRKYNKKYNEYLRKINELNKIIDEKEHKNEKRKWIFDISLEFCEKIYGYYNAEIFSGRCG